VTEKKRRSQPGDAGPPGDEAASPPARDTASAPSEQEEQVERDLSDLLADVERERDEYLELARRTKADFENYRRRMSNEAAGAERRGRADIARQLIPVLDNLERALEVAESDDRSLAKGVDLVLEELRAVLERNGIKSYEPSGQPFDPEWHEAMMTRPAGQGESGKVLEVLQKGYRLDGQVLRPARVVVGAAAPEEAPADGEAAGGPEHHPSAAKPADGSQER
jgi:molecular chaperone GrpE